MINTETTQKIDHLERQVKNLTKLVEINHIINSTLDIAKLLTIIMEIIKDIMIAEASTLLLYEENDKELVFKVALGDAGKELTEKYRVKLGQGVAGWVAERRKPLMINDAYNDDRFDPNFDKKTGFKTKSIVCVPLLFKGKLLGVIQAINPRNRTGFDENDMTLFTAFADQAALTVQNAILFKNALEEERIKKELTSARAFQDALLPAVDKKFDNILVASKSIPAREVGGEFYDIYCFDDKSIGIALGDIHKKGIPGALNASVISGAIKASLNLIGHSPSALLNHLNKIVRDNIDPIQNVSLFYGLISHEKMNIEFVNAGIAYPILVRKNIARYLKFSSKSLGEKSISPKKIKVSLEPDDYFVIITDGIINLKNKGSQTLGLKRIMDHLSGQFSSPQNLIDSLIQMANNFTEQLEKREDISIIAFKIIE